MSGGGGGTGEDSRLHIEHSNSISSNLYGYWHDIYSATSMGFMGAEWSESRYRWVFNFKFAGTASSRKRNTGNAADMIRVTAMEFKGTSNTSNLGFLNFGDSRYIGSAPESGTSLNYYTIANAIVGLAITTINNFGICFAWSLLDFLKALINSVDYTSTQEDYKWLEWNWSSDISDTGQFYWFAVEVAPNQTVQISYDYSIFGPVYECFKTGIGYLNLTAPEPNANPYTVIVEEPLKMENITPCTKDALIKEVNNQIDRSKQIKRVFKNVMKKNSNEENLTIIQKHEALLVLLDDFINRVQSINENDSKAINSLWKELKNDILEKTTSSQN